MVQHHLKIVQLVLPHFRDFDPLLHIGGGKLRQGRYVLICGTYRSEIHLSSSIVAMLTGIISVYTAHRQNNFITNKSVFCCITKSIKTYFDKF